MKCERLQYFITSTKEVMFSSLFVYLSISNCTKTPKWICMKISGKVGIGPMNKSGMLVLGLGLKDHKCRPWPWPWDSRSWP